MSNKNTFEGLQFRILETLEKQPNHAPLMATEIAERLHTTEYRDEMKDNVVFKVTRAVHSMKERGKILTADARGPQGQLCYQLPHRLKFPAKPSVGPPVNPVLTAETAAQIRTVEPEPEKLGRGRAVYVPGVGDKIVEMISKSPYPVTSRDVMDKIGPLYHHVTKNAPRIQMIIAGHLNHLLKQTRRIKARPSSVRGTKYEYYTRHTGTLPHPLSNSKGVPVDDTPLGDKLIRLLDQSEQPLTVAEISARAKEFYPIAATDVHKRVNYMISYLKKMKKISAHKAPKGRGASLVYFTNKTGSLPASEAVVEVRKTVTEPEPIYAPPPVSHEPLVTRTPPSPGLFRPGVKKVELVQLNLDVPREKRDAWKEAAAQFGVPLVQLVTEAMDYALLHAETE